MLSVSWLDKLFKNKNKDPTIQMMETPVENGGSLSALMEYMLSGKEPEESYYLQKSLYNFIFARMCIDKIATECSKAVPMPVRPNKKLSFILGKQPNPYQSTSRFLYQLVTCYLVDNNVYVVPLEDEYGNFEGLWVVPDSKARIGESKGRLVLEYQTDDGRKRYIQYESCFHMKRMQYERAFTGESNEVVKKLAGLYEESLSRSLESLRASGRPAEIMARLNTSVANDEDLKIQQRRFANLNTIGNRTGVILFDGRYDQVTQLQRSFNLLKAEDIQEAESMNFNYWQISKKILQNTYSEDEWNGFFQSRIEPILIEIGQGLSKMVYSKTARMYLGDEIVLSANKLQYASIKSRIELAFGIFDRGMADMDDSREILNLPPLPDGEGKKRYIRGEYRPEDQPYQGGDESADNSEKFDVSNGSENGEQKDPKRLLRRRLCDNL